MTTKSVARKFLPVLFILTLLIIFVSAVSASTVTTVLATDMDTYIQQDNANATFGDITQLNVRSYSTTGPTTNRNQRAFVRFNLPSLPSGAVVVTATLRLNMTTNPGGTGGRTYSVYRVTGSPVWTEAGLNWNNQPTVAAGATANLNVGSTTGFKDWDVTADVQNFYGGTNNFGWMIRDSSESSTTDRLGVFSSSEGSTAPQLIIAYNQKPNAPTNATPANNGFVTSGNPTFTWTNTPGPGINDPDGDTQNQIQVQVRTNAGTYGGANSEDSGAVNNTGNSYTPTTFNMADGVYCWHVRLHDISNASNSWSDYSADTCFTKDGANPSSSAAVVPQYANTPFQVTATATDATSGVANVRLYFRGPTGNWTLVSQINAPNAYQWTFTPALGNGTYYFQSVACDNAGNCETAPTGTTGTGDDSILYDTTAPTSQATPPVGPITTPPLNIPWTANDAVSGIAANGVALWVKTPGSPNFAATGLTASGTSGTFSYTPASGDGSYCFYTLATDNAGNVEAAPAGANGDGCTTYKTLGSIGDLVWLDSNGNGIKDPAESGINGVTLTLTRGATVVGNATTASGGAYLFSGLQGAQQVTVRDNFSSNAYTNNDGTRNWAGAWTETDSNGGGATGGNIEVNGGLLYLTQSGSSIARTANLSGSITANLSFDLDTNNVESGDTAVVEISTDGGASYTPLETINGSASGSRNYDITPYISANTRIQFRLANGYTGFGEEFVVDNVQIQYQDTSQSTYTVTVDASNFNSGGPLFGLSATSTPASPAVVTLDTATDDTAVDFGYGAFATIGDLIYVDSNRNGAYDSGEPGLPGVTVRLYTDGNGNGKIDGADGPVSGKSAISDSNGLYAIRGVTPGNYTVYVDPNDAGLLGAFRASSPNPVAVANVTGTNTYNNADIGFVLPPGVVKPLYLHRTLNDTLYLDRNAPSGADTSHDVNGGAWHTWALTPALADKLALVPGGLLTVTIHIDLASDNIPLNVRLHRTSDPTTNYFFNYTYTGGQSGLQLLVFTGTVPLNMAPFNAGDQIYLSLQKQGNRSSWPVYQNASKVELPTYSYIKVINAGTYDATYPGGGLTSTFIQGDTVYIRATASDPFGAYDISGMTVNVPGVFTNTAMSLVSSGTLTKTYEISRSGLLNSNYSYTVTAAEGSEGQVTAVATGTFQIIVSNLGNSSKTVDKATAAPGDLLTYTIVLSNTGGLAATVRMTDTLPANTTYISGPTGAVGGSYNAGLNAVLFNGTIPANGQATLSYVVRVNTPLDNGTIVANSATIDDGFSKFDTSPPATTVISSAPNLSSSTKTVNAATAAPGDSLDYTIVLSNTGNMNAVIAQANPLIDEVPANTSFNGGLFASAGQISYNPGFNRVEWYGTVPAGITVTLRYRARVNTPLDNGTVISNTATINEGTGFPTPQTYQRTATTTIVSAPNLSGQSVKLVDKALAVPGDSLAYTIILKNSGNMNAPGVVLTDTLPAQVTWGGNAFLSATSGTAQFITATNTVVWTGDMNAGATVQILFRATANTPLANNTQITNVAQVADGLGNFTPFNLQAITTIQSTPNLNTSTKTVNTATAVPGDVLTYTIRLVNTGNAVAATSVLDNLPAQLQNPVIVSVSSGTAVVGGNAITWTGQVTPTQPVTITFRATLLSVLNNGTQVSNTAQVNDGVNAPFFINPPAVTTISSAPNLSTSRKIVNLATASPNDLLIYTITLTNTGNMVANAQVLDTLPSYVTFNGGLSASGGAPLPTYSSINNRVSWQGSVAPGTPVSISYQVRINTPLDNGTVILNDAQISDGVNPFFDTTPPAQTTITSAPDLSTSYKTVDLVTAAPGDLLHYIIHLINTGNMVATSTTSISDTLPTQVSLSSGPFVSGGGSGGYNPGQRRIFWNGSVTPGSDVIVEYYATVNNPLANGTQIINDAVIQGSFGTITTNAVTTTVQSDHQLSLNKTAPTIVGAGQVMTYTLEYNVTGNEPAPTVVITDAIPANTSYVANSCAPAPCSLNAGIVTWTLNNLNPGNSGIATMRVNVTSPLPNGTVITNTARISDADNGAAQSSATTTVTSGHGFSLTKRDTGFDPIEAGAQITYNLDWAVSGPETPIGVIITDVVPISTTYVSCSGATCSLTGNTVTWTLGNPATGSSGTVSMVVTVANPLPNGIILTNQARISDSNSGVPTTATEQTTVHSSHSLDVEKSAPISTPAGGQITYSIAYTVTGNEAAQNLVIEDTTPPNTTFVSAAGASIIESPLAGGTGLVRWRLGTLNPGSTGVVTLVVNVVSPLPNGTVVNNTALIQDSNGGATDVDAVNTTITSGHGFTLSKSDTPDPVAPGNIINYAIHWAVNSNEPAQNVTITDTIPANTTFFGCSGCAQQGSTVQWNLGNHNPGENGDVTLQVQVNSPLPNGTVITNTARVSDSNGGTPASATTTTTVQSAHQLTLSKSAPSIVQAGQDINYTLNWSVTGNEGAPGVVITDAIPANTTYVVGSCIGCTVAGGIVTWNMGDLVPGNSGSLSLAVTTSGVLTNGTRITNTARIADTKNASAQASAVTTISSGHGFNLSKTDSVDPVQAGASLTYTINWSIAGTEQAQNVVITDTLPANTSYASCAPAPCSLTGSTVTWTVGNQLPNTSGSVTLTVNVAGALANGTILSNQARIGDSNGGLATTSNVEQTTVHSSHSLIVNKIAPATVASGGQIVYSIVYTVAGNEPAQNVVIEDNTPVNTTFASAVGGSTINSPGVGNSGLVRWNLPTPLNPGATGVVTLTVNVNSPLANGTPINNTASIRDNNNGTTGQDSTTTTVSSGHALTLTKTDSPDPVAPGNFINYTIHWTVTGNESAQNVVITDAIPANTTFFNCSGCSQQGSFVQWNLGNHNPGESGDATLQLQVTTPLTNGTVITNTARISDNSGGAPVTATTTTTVQSAHQLTLSKSAPSIVQAGQDINYTLNWSVTGNEGAPGVVITDAIPANTTYVVGSCIGCTVAGGIVTWNMGDLVPGNSGSLSLAVTTSGVLTNGTRITNTARIADTKNASAQASAVTTISSGHGFNLSKTDSVDPVQAGASLTYTINWSVIGSEQAQNVVITDTLPANTSYASCAPAPCSLTGSTVTWTVGNQLPNTSGSVTLTVNVAGALANGTILSNQARIGDSNGGLATTSNVELTTVNSSHSLIVNKIAPATVASGGQIVYSIVYTVAGNEPAQNVVIEDNTPVNTTFASAVGGSSIVNPGVGNSGLVRWNLPTPLNPGATGVVTLTVNVNSPLANGTTINNTASIRDSNNGTTGQDSTTTTVSSGHALTLTKTDSPDPVAPGNFINYTIHWTVTGNEPAQNVVITDAIPANTTFASCGSCSQQGGGTFVQWNLGTHSPGESGDATLQLQVTTPLTNGTVITNVARISDSNGGVAVTASTTTTVQSAHQLTLSKSAPSIVQAGQNINYTINWSVTGNEAAPGVVITDAVPANTSYVSCSGGVTCSLTAGIVTWTLGNLVPGNSGTVNLTVTAGGLLPNGTVITNTARIRDNNGIAAQASASTTVSSGHGFSLSKTDSVDPVQAGAQLTYTIGWSVIGTEQAQNVVISDTLPANTSFASCTPAPCSLGAGNIVTWTVGNPLPNSSGSVSLTVNVAGALANGTILSNQARIGDGNGGLAATSNIEQTVVNSSHSLRVDKVAPATVASGGQLVYTIAYTVTGNEPAQNVVIEDNTPVNTTFASATGGSSIVNPGVGNSGLVRWTLPTPLNPGATGVVTLTVNVDSPLANGTTINNTASIRDSNNGATSQDSTTTTVSSGHALTLTKTDTPDPAAPGNFINYTIHWTVTGNEPAQNVVITDAIPANTTFFGCSGCSQQGSFVQWNLGTHSPGESGDATLQVQVTTPLTNGTVITNTARISDGNGGAPVTATTTTTIQSSNQLTLSKNAPSIVQAGQPINYTINWAVTGNQAAPGVVITDAVPANTSYVSCSGGVTCSLTAGIVTWTLGNLVPGNSGTVNLTVTAGGLLPNGTVITNTARIRDNNGIAAQSSASTTVSSGHGFNLSKTDSVDPVQAGASLTYTINWSVIGSEQAQNVVISDTLPANTSFASCTPAPCSLGAGNIVTWTLGNRNPSTNGSVSLTVNVAGALANGTILSNQARIGDSNGGIVTTSNIEQTTVNSSHTLRVDKVAPATVASGGQIVYTIAYTVSGNEPAQNVVIEDNTPVNTTFASATGGSTISNPGVGNSGLVRWTLPTPLNPGATGVVTLIVNVNSPLSNGTLINNTASIRDSNNGVTGQDSTTTTINSSHGFTLTKTDSPDPVSPGNLINYTIHWTVTGNEPAQNVVITDAIPANTTFFGCGGCSLQGGGTFVQWNLGNRSPGESGDVTLQLQVNQLTPNGTVITNTASIFDNNNGPRVSASTTTTVQSSHTLTLDKRAPATVAAGQQIVYTIDYNVVGNELAPSVVITDPIPAGTTYIVNSCTGGCTVNGNVVTWNLGNLLPNVPGQVQFAVRVDNTVPNGTDITNIAYIRDNSGASATDNTITRVGTDLLIDLTDNLTTVQPGDRITYTASYSGTEPLNFGTVEIDIPANTTFVSASGGFLQTGSTIFWLVTSQPAGFSGQRYIVVQLPPVMDNGTVISTTARIAGDGKSNRDNESATVESQPNLSTSVKTVSDPGARASSLVTYQIVLSNTGNMHAHNTVINDSIPTGVTYAGNLTASVGTPTYVGGVIGWQGEVQVGTPVTVRFTAQVDANVSDGQIIENVVDINDGFHPNLIQKVATIAVGRQAPSSGQIFLPIIIVNGANSAPPTGPDVELTIQNCGSVNALGAFWVDLYFNPNEQSIFWPISHGEGYDWFGQGAAFAVSSLGPGQSINLYLANATLKNMPSTLSSSARLYAQVDTYDSDNGPSGPGVVDEGTAGEANNVAGVNGSTCNATAGKSDLIVTSIRFINTSAAATSATKMAPVEGAAVAPTRLQPPQQ